jgi:FMN-dependent NADH-azoreductase
VPHLDGEGMNASYVPEESRSPSMQEKLQLRLDLIAEITSASHIVISTPMWNWGMPSRLKAYIDQIILPGVLDPYSNKGLTGKIVTVLIACGGEYSSDPSKAATNFLTGHISQILNFLGAEDVSVIQAEFTLAGIVPGMESLVEAKEASIAKAIEAAVTRAGAI